jgi:transmembrane sensor
MDNKSQSAPVNAQIYEEACEWFLEFRLGEPDMSSHKKFDTWMRRSPEHIAAYLQAAAVWSEPAAHDVRGRWDANTLIAQARAAPDNVSSVAERGARGGRSVVPKSSIDQSAGNQNPSALRSSDQTQLPVPIGDPFASSINSAHRSLRRRFMRYALAASVVLAVIATSMGMWQYVQGETYRTAIGEQRSIVLEDGSIVDLNSKSIIRVRYRQHERHVDVSEGQALFNVVANKTRPFVVESNGTLVRAVGTQFDVYRKRSGTVVTVVEGSVAVKTPIAAAASPGGRASANELLLNADEQVVVDPNISPEISKGTASMAIAWTRRKMVFSGASIMEVAEEFNRYSTRRLGVENPDDFDFRISGVFSSADVTPLIRFLNTRAGVEVVESPSEILIRKKRS